MWCHSAEGWSTHEEFLQAYIGKSDPAYARAGAAWCFPAGLHAKNLDTDTPWSICGS